MVPRVDKFIETESGTVVIAGGWGKRSKEPELNGPGDPGAEEACGLQPGAGVLPDSVLDVSVTLHIVCHRQNRINPKATRNDKLT